MSHRIYEVWTVIFLLFAMDTSIGEIGMNKLVGMEVQEML